MPIAAQCRGLGTPSISHPDPKPHGQKLGRRCLTPPRLCLHPGCVPEVSATPTWGDPAGVWLWAGDTLTPGPPGLSPQGTAGMDRVAQEARPPVSCDSQARPGAQWGRGHKIPLPQRSPGTLQPEPEAGGRGGACHGCHRPRGNSEARVGTLSWGAAPTGLYKHKPDPMGAGADLGVQKALNRRWGGKRRGSSHPQCPPTEPHRDHPHPPHAGTEQGRGHGAPTDTRPPSPCLSFPTGGSPHPQHPTAGSARRPPQPHARSRPQRAGGRRARGGAGGVQGVAAGSGALPAGVFLEPVASSPSCDGDGI